MIELIITLISQKPWFWGHAELIIENT